MRLRVFDDKVSLGKAAAIQAAAAIRSAIAERGQARVVAASAASQFEFLEALIATVLGSHAENARLASVVLSGGAGAL